MVDTPDLGVQEMLAGHPHATLPRSRAQEVVWRVQETPFRDDGTPPPKAGMGPVQGNTRADELLHPTVVWTPERVN